MIWGGSCSSLVQIFRRRRTLTIIDVLVRMSEEPYGEETITGQTQIRTSALVSNMTLLNRPDFRKHLPVTNSCLKRPQCSCRAQDEFCRRRALVEDEVFTP